MKKKYLITTTIIIMLNGCAGVSHNNEVVFDDPKKNIELFDFKKNSVESQINFNKTNSIDFSENKKEKYNFNTNENFGSQKYYITDKKIDVKDNIDFSKTEKISFDNTEKIDFNNTEKISFDNTEKIDFNNTEEISLNNVDSNYINNKLNNHKDYEVINVDERMKQDKEETTEIKNTIKEIPGKIVDVVLHPGKVLANALYPTTIDVVNDHNAKNVKEYIGNQYNDDLDYNLGKKVDYDSEEDY